MKRPAGKRGKTAAKRAAPAAQLNRTIWCDRGFLPLYYGFCPSATAWRYDMRKLEVDDPPPYPESDGHTWYFYNRTTGKGAAIVTIADKLDAMGRKDPEAMIGLIVHETMHVWRHQRELIGEDKPSSEFEAYAMQFMVQQLYRAYCRTRGRGTRP